jgi:hypothetical protein
MIRLGIVGLLLGLLAGCDGVDSSTGSSTPSTVTTKDTTILSGDSTQCIVTTTMRGSSMVAQTSDTVPVTAFVWFQNRYASAVFVEVWAGDSLEWRNGHVLGYGLHQLPDTKASSDSLKVGGTRRLCARKQKELLALVGLPSTAGSGSAVFLALMHYRDVSAGDTLWLDSEGLLQRKR